MGWQALGMESKWQINILHFLITLWMGDILHMHSGSVPGTVVSQLPGTRGMASGVVSGR